MKRYFRMFLLLSCVKLVLFSLLPKGKIFFLIVKTIPEIFNLIKLSIAVKSQDVLSKKIIFSKPFKPYPYEQPHIVAQVSTV